MGTLSDRHPVRYCPFVWLLLLLRRYIISGHYVLGILATTGDETKRKMSVRERYGHWISKQGNDIDKQTKLSLSVSVDDDSLPHLTRIGRHDMTWQDKVLIPLLFLSKLSSIFEYHRTRSINNKYSQIVKRAVLLWIFSPPDTSEALTCLYRFFVVVVPIIN